ncbi:hypothetical protein O6H91_06G042900 [Diphasiastrum complanatum]|uniref:Uncharacterized protein n=1 Tax=Diphasiastrum complanatum TaxID=34168 RepID=A0ACC2DD14_DIPCM|nr:hypothetical protein O6H91_06G042900 [Diphasiastrum complanatum]
MLASNVSRVRHIPLQKQICPKLHGESSLVVPTSTSQRRKHSRVILPPQKLDRRPKTLHHRGDTQLKHTSRYEIQQPNSLIAFNMKVFLSECFSLSDLPLFTHAKAA